MPSSLDKDLPVPLYHQLQCVLKAEIEGGKWQPDRQIPTETKVARSFGVSKIAVRQAMQGLAEQGYIRRGTFVARRNFD
jgi:DNA-binding GntR family transcriptional regulator